MRRFIATSFIALSCVGLVISASVADLSPEFPVTDAPGLSEETVTDEAPVAVLEAPAQETLTQCNGCGCEVQPEVIGTPCNSCGEVVIGDQYGPGCGEQFIGGEQIVGEQIVGEQIIGEQIIADPFASQGFAPSGYSGGGGFGGGGGGGGFGGGGSLVGLAGLGLGIGALAVATNDDDTVAAPASP